METHFVAYHPTQRPGRAVLFVSCLSLALLSVAGACSTLPDVRALIRDSARSPVPVAILGLHGPLPAAESRALLRDLQAGLNPAGILEGNLATMAAAGSEPPSIGNRVSLLVDGDTTFAEMLRAIERATDHVNFETYIIDDDEMGRFFSDLLVSKRAAGVEVNFIYDSFGCRGTAQSFFDRLKAGGVNVVEFNPMKRVFSLRGTHAIYKRTHRKMVIVDGITAFVGGINIGNAYMRSRRHKGDPSTVDEYWRDADVMIEGPAVAQFQRLFMATWADQGGPALMRGTYFPKQERCGDQLVQVVGSRPGYMNRRTYAMYLSAIAHASRSIHLTHSYFAPDAEILEALKDAARRGVDVRLILPGYTDHLSVRHAARSYYTGLLEAGVRIYERSDTILHAKTAVIDGVWSTVGSTNLELWSFAATDEINAVVLDRSFAAEMESLFQDDLDESVEILPADWKRRPLFDRAAQLFFSLFRYWM